MDCKHSRIGMDWDIWWYLMIFDDIIIIFNTLVQVTWDDLSFWSLLSLLRLLRLLKDLGQGFSSLILAATVGVGQVIPPPPPHCATSPSLGSAAHEMRLAVTGTRTRTYLPVLRPFPFFSSCICDLMEALQTLCLLLEEWWLPKWPGLPSPICKQTYGESRQRSIE